MVITAGKLSGMAATASATAVKSASNTDMFLFKIIWTKKTIKTIPKTPNVITFPILSIFFSSGVFSFIWVFKIFAILPISVFFPTAKTTPFALPEVTVVPE